MITFFSQSFNPQALCHCGHPRSDHSTQPQRSILPAKAGCVASGCQLFKTVRTHYDHTGNNVNAHVVINLKNASVVVPTSVCVQPVTPHGPQCGKVWLEHTNQVLAVAPGPILALPPIIPALPGPLSQRPGVMVAPSTGPAAPWSSNLNTQVANGNRMASSTNHGGRGATTSALNVPISRRSSGQRQVNRQPFHRASQLPPTNIHKFNLAIIPYAVSNFAEMFLLADLTLYKKAFFWLF